MYIILESELQNSTMTQKMNQKVACYFKIKHTVAFKLFTFSFQMFMTLEIFLILITLNATLRSNARYHP